MGHGIDLKEKNIGARRADVSKQRPSNKPCCQFLTCPWIQYNVDKKSIDLSFTAKRVRGRKQLRKVGNNLNTWDPLHGVIHVIYVIYLTEVALSRVE